MNFRPIRSREEYERLTAAARADGHGALYPTWCMEKDGELVGAASLPWSPTVYCWAHTQKISALESVRALRQCEAAVATHGYSSLIVPCMPNSPFFPVMERLGYQDLGQAHFFHKTITNGKDVSCVSIPR